MSRILYDYVDDNILIARCLGNEEELKDCFLHMNEHRFGPINFGGYLMKYSYEEMSVTKGYKILTSQKVMDLIIPIDEVDENIRKSFRENHLHQVEYVRQAVENNAIVLALVQDGAINGISYIVKADEENYAVPIAYINRLTKYELAIPFLIAASARYLERIIGPRFNLLVCPSYEKGHNGFLSMFGQPMAEVRVHDYSIVFRKKNELETAIEKIDEHNRETAAEDDPFSSFYNVREMCWVSAAASRRIPYVSDIRKMPDSSYQYTEKEIYSWMDKWQLPKLLYWKKIVYQCGRTKGTLNSLSIENILNKDCRELFEDIRKEGKLPELPPLQVNPDEVRIRIFPDDEIQAYEILPEHLKKQIYDRDLLVVGAITPDDEVIGITVTDLMEQLGRIAYLKYAYVLQGIDSEPILKKMIETTVQVIAESGCDALYVKSLYQENGMAVYDLAAMMGDAVTLKKESESRQLCYRIKQILNGRLPEMYDRKDLKLPKVSFPEEINEKSLQIFQRDCWEAGIAFDINRYDRQYTGFIFDGPLIVAAVFAEQVSENELTIRDLYLSKRADSTLAPFALVSSVITKAAKQMHDDALVILRLSIKNQVEAMRKIIGEPVSTTIEKEYFFELNDSLSETLETEKILLPESARFKRGFLEKLRISTMLYQGNDVMEGIFSMLLDMSSQMPGAEICLYISHEYIF